MNKHFCEEFKSKLLFNYFFPVTKGKVPNKTFDYVLQQNTTYTPSFHALENRYQKVRMNEVEIELDDVSKGMKMSTSKIT